MSCSLYSWECWINNRVISACERNFSIWGSSLHLSYFPLRGSQTNSLNWMVCPSSSFYPIWGIRCPGFSFWAYLRKKERKERMRWWCLTTGRTQNFAMAGFLNWDYRGSALRVPSRIFSSDSTSLFGSVLATECTATGPSFAFRPCLGDGFIR